jgi:hypothetical protein
MTTYTTTVFGNVDQTVASTTTMAAPPGFMPVQISEAKPTPAKRNAALSSLNSDSLEASRTDSEMTIKRAPF